VQRAAEHDERADEQRIDDRGRQETAQGQVERDEQRTQEQTDDGKVGERNAEAIGAGRVGMRRWQARQELQGDPETGDGPLPWTPDDRRRVT
jgi:hypothetical protein